MKLSDFLKTADVEKAYQSLFPLGKVEAKDDKGLNLSDRLLKMDLTVLIKLAIRYPEIDKMCESPELASHWQDIWRKSASEIGTESKLEYSPIPTVSCFSQIKGLYIYKAYQDLIKGEELTQTLRDEAREYLELSSRLGCYFASKVLCEQGLKLLSVKPDIDLAATVLEVALQASVTYWTPGYLLLATVYQEFSQYSEEFFTGSDARSKQVLFKQALIALYVAQKLEDFSGPMLINAYRGKTIEEATGGAIKSWTQARVRLQTLSSGYITSLVMMVAEREASVIADKIKKEYQLGVIAAQDSPYAQISSSTEEELVSPRWTGY
jgi:hypothetical protein